MAKQTRKGLFIVFEGIDGTGKSTQLNLLSQYLQQHGFPVIATREPTDGVYGQKIRQLYLHRAQCSPEEELELFLADRREHVDTLLTPSLREGKIVLCDRYFLSTAAYQGAADLDPEYILELNTFAPDPDIALVFQSSLKTTQKRIISGRGEGLNDFEQEENLQKVAAIFASIKRPYIQEIDANKSINQVHKEVLMLLTPLLSTFFCSS